MAATQQLVRNTASLTNASDVAASFLQLCSTTAVLHPTGRCSTAQAAIAKAVGGNPGKRAAGMCAALQLCTTSLSSECSVDVMAADGTTKQVAAPLLDRCTGG